MLYIISMITVCMYSWVFYLLFFCGTLCLKYNDIILSYGSLDKMDIMMTSDRELILAELYKLQHPSGPSLEQVIHEQMSYCSDYSDRSSSIPADELVELAEGPFVTDVDATEATLEFVGSNERY